MNQLMAFMQVESGYDKTLYRHSWVVFTRWLVHIQSYITFNIEQELCDQSFHKHVYDHFASTDIITGII